MSYNVVDIIANDDLVIDASGGTGWVDRIPVPEPIITSCVVRWRQGWKQYLDSTNTRWASTTSDGLPGMRPPATPKAASWQAWTWASTGQATILAGGGYRPSTSTSRAEHRVRRGVGKPRGRKTMRWSKSGEATVLENIYYPGMPGTFAYAPARRRVAGIP